MIAFASEERRNPASRKNRHDPLELASGLSTQNTLGDSRSSRLHRVAWHPPHKRSSAPRCSTRN
jgi:hypothetical protein